MHRQPVIQSPLKNLLKIVKYVKCPANAYSIIANGTQTLTTKITLHAY